MPRGDNQYINRWDPVVMNAVGLSTRAAKFRARGERIARAREKIKADDARKGLARRVWERVDKTVIGTVIGAVSGAAGSYLGDKLGSALGKRMGLGAAGRALSAAASRVPGARFTRGGPGVVLGAVIGAVAGAYSGWKQDKKEDVHRALRIQEWALAQEGKQIRKATADLRAQTAAAAKADATDRALRPLRADAYAASRRRANSSPSYAAGLPKYSAGSVEQVLVEARKYKGMSKKK